MHRLMIRTWNIARDARLIAILSTIAVLLISNSYHRPFNIDGLIYLHAALAYITDGISAAKQVYPWPFYSIFVGIISHLFHLQLLTAAYLIDGVFTIIMAITFVLLIRSLGGNNNLQFMGIFIFLLYPSLFHFYNNVMRDYGYYAFSLISVLMLIYYFKKPLLIYALAWGISTGLATLFRIEGVVFLILIPLGVLFHNQWLLSEKLKHFFRLNIINLLAATLIVIGLIVTKHDFHSMGRLSDTLKILANPSSLLMDVFAHIQILQNSIFNTVVTANGATIFFIGGTIALFIANLFTCITPIYALLSYYAFRYHLLAIERDVLKCICSYILVNLAILTYFIFSQLFLTTRYIMPLSFLLILGIPFAIQNIYQNWREKKATLTGKAWLFPILVIVLASLYIGQLLHIGPSKTYIIHTGHWIQQNIPANKKVLISDPQMLYYAQRNWTDYPNGYNIADPNSFSYRRLNQVDLSTYDYFAVTVRKKEIADAEMLFKNLNLQAVMTYHNNVGDVAYILKKAG